MAEFMRKLRKRQQVKIVTRGDSVTYGYDSVSADRVAPPDTVLPDGSTHLRERSPRPWPTALQECLNDVYNGAVTVENQGYSGDYVERGFNRWFVNVGADCTIICYGVNDSHVPGVPAHVLGNLETYVRDIERMIVREHEWGSAVVLLAPIKRLGTAGNVDTDIYTNALRPLANKYGIPLVDGDQLLMNYRREVWSEGPHLNTKGNSIIGARLAALFVGDGPDKPMRVTGGSKLLGRQTIDNVFHSRGVSLLQSAGYETPQEDVKGQGTALFFSTPYGSEGVAFWSFYTETPDTVIFPVAYVAPVAGETGARLEFTLDFGVDQADNFHDKLVNGAAPSTAGIGPLAAGSPAVYQYDPAAAQAFIRVVTPGWHTLKVRGFRSINSGLNLQALEFFDAREWMHHYEDWKPLAVASGLANMGEPTRVMRDGSMITLELGVKPATGQFPAGNTVLLAEPLPPEFRPRANQNFTATSQGGATMRLQVNASGVVQLLGLTGGTNNYIASGFHYRK